MLEDVLVDAGLVVLDQGELMLMTEGTREVISGMPNVRSV